jgi:hypothetical protein
MKKIEEAQGPEAVSAVSSGFVSQAAGEVALVQVLDAAFAELETRSGTSFVGISALAMGADTVFAERVLGRGGRLRAFLPEEPENFFNLVDFGANPALLERSRRLFDHPNLIERRVAGYGPTRGLRFAQCAGKIIDSCDLLFVAISAKEWGIFEEWRNDVASHPEVTTVHGPATQPEPIPSFFSAGGSAGTLCSAFRVGRECRVFVPDGCGGWARGAVPPANADRRHSGFCS